MTAQKKAVLTATELADSPQTANKKKFGVGLGHWRRVMRMVGCLVG